MLHCSANEITKLQADFINPNTTRNLRKINAELGQIQDIMKENLADIMSRGQSLDALHETSHKIRDSSGKFKKEAKWVNTKAKLQQMALPCACVSVIILIVLFRYWF